VAANGEEVKRAAMAELARRELARRQAAAPKYTFGDRLRATGRDVRDSAVDMYRGVSGIANLPFDALTDIYNRINAARYPRGYDVTIDGQKVHRSGQIPNATEQREQALAAAGLTPQYSGKFEEIAGAANRGFGGAATTMGIGGLMTGAPSVVASGVGSQLTAQPLAQLVSAGTGGASGEVARQQGAGPLGQFAASLIGGVAGGALTPKTPPTSADLYNDFLASQNRLSQQAARAPAPQPNFAGIADDTTGLNESMARVAKTGQAMGFRLTPGQVSGSKALQQLEAKLESQPFTSAPFNEIRANNQTVLNRAVGSNLGLSSSVLDESKLAGALEDIQARFRDAADDNIRPIDAKDYLRFAAELQDETRGLVKGVLSHDLMEDLTKFATEGGATGEQLQSLTSKLGAAANKQMTTPMGDRDLGIALFRAKEYVDDLLTQGMDEKRLNNFMEARAQYRSLMLLTQRSGVVNPSSGNVRGNSLATVLQQKDKRGFLFGQNRTPMYEAARFSQAFAPIIGDSGTSTRLPTSLTDYLIGLPTNLASRLYTSRPSVSAATNAAALARAVGGRAPPTVGGVYPSGLAAALLAQDQERRRREQR